MQVSYQKKLARREYLYNRYESGLPKYKPIGCTLDEIAELEKKAQIKFPQAYKEYLFICGKKNHLYASGIGFCYEELADIQEQSKLLLEEENTSIPGEIWVTDILYNDNFYFFYLTDGDNPPVYHWDIDLQGKVRSYENGIIQVTKSFSQYINNMVPSKFEKVAGRIIGIFLSSKI